MTCFDELTAIPVRSDFENMGTVLIHTVFDLLASLTAFSLTVLAYRIRLSEMDRFDLNRYGLGYGVALVLGAALGGYGFGTYNLVLSGQSIVGRSIVGALAGAIFGVEIYKKIKKIRGSTGVIFVPGFCATIIVGRLGCYFSGLDDHTFGIATSLPWGVDYGDGVPRHPVPLYESACMAVFLAFAGIRIFQRDPWFLSNGFYLMVAAYAGQRFVWEFLKPYGTLLGPLNLFHLVCAGLFAYALIMMGRQQHVRT